MSGEGSAGTERDARTVEIDGHGNQAGVVPEQAPIEDALVEDISIDGMCGVY
jgi:mycofactocin precursor